MHWPIRRTMQSAPSKSMRYTAHIHGQRIFHRLAILTRYGISLVFRVHKPISNEPVFVQPYSIKYIQFPLLIIVPVYPAGLQNLSGYLGFCFAYG